MGGLGDTIRAAQVAAELRAERKRSEAETRKAGKPERAGVTFTADEATITLSPSMDGGPIDLDDLLAAHGLGGDEWIVERTTPNHWQALAYGGGADGEARVVTLHQLKAALVHRDAVLRPALPVAKRYTPKQPRKPTAKRPQLWVATADHHCPHHDKDLHKAFLRWLTDVKPDGGVIAGDLGDYSTVSKYSQRKRWAQGVVECLDSSHAVLSDYRDAHPDTRWKVFDGNHDARLDGFLRRFSPEIADMRRARKRGEPPEGRLLSLRNLLHLDALGVEYVGDLGGDWGRSELTIAPGLVVRHAPLKPDEAARLSRSVMTGHNHRQGIDHITTYGEDDQPNVRTLVHVGAMADTQTGLGYTDHANWQPGFATATVHSDGAMSFDLATWRGGVLTWRGERWKP